METQRLTLNDLARKTGFEPRTIRSYVAHGIVPGPDSLGRAASYPPEALTRLKLFSLLRDAHRGVLGLDAARQLIDGLSPATIDDLAEGRRSLAEVIPPSLVEKAASKGNAVAYLHSLGQASHGLAAGGSPPHGSHGHAHARHSGHTKADAGGLSDTDLPRLAHAAQALADLVGFTSARSSRGTTWYRIPLTRDIELSVRGDIAPEQLASIHRIADSLRLLLTKGSKS